MKVSLCNYLDCKNKVMKVIGYCKLCEIDYCGRHRLPEIHNCVNLNELYTAHKTQLNNKLLNEATKDNKLTKI